MRGELHHYLPRVKTVSFLFVEESMQNGLYRQANRTCNSLQGLKCPPGRHPSLFPILPILQSGFYLVFMHHKLPRILLTNRRTKTYLHPSRPSFKTGDLRVQYPTWSKSRYSNIIQHLSQCLGERQHSCSCSSSPPPTVGGSLQFSLHAGGLLPGWIDDPADNSAQILHWTNKHMKWESLFHQSRDIPRTP